MSAPPFDPAGFYELATVLLSNAQNESYLRTSVSRAYYACFHLATLGCRRKWSWEPPSYGEHRAVVRKLREQRQLYLAANLQTLLGLRELADYDLNVSVDEATCRQALTLAAQLVPRLRSL